MSIPTPPDTKSESRDCRAFVLLDGQRSLVVRDSHVAFSLAHLFVLQPIPVESLEHAHEVLLAVYRQVPTSAREVLLSPEDTDFETGPYATARVETAEGEVLEGPITDPGMIGALEDLLI